MDPSRDESLFFELLDFKHDVADNGSAAWFLQDLAREQDAEGSSVCGHFSLVSSSYRISVIWRCNWYIEIGLCCVYPMHNMHLHRIGCGMCRTVGTRCLE